MRSTQDVAAAISAIRAGMRHAAGDLTRSGERMAVKVQSARQAGAAIIDIRAGTDRAHRQRSVGDRDGAQKRARDER